MVLSHKYTGNVYNIYIISVATKPCFQDHWKFDFVSTQRRTRFIMVGLSTRGRVGSRAGRLQPRFLEYFQGIMPMRLKK